MDDDAHEHAPPHSPALDSAHLLELCSPLVIERLRAAELLREPDRLRPLASAIGARLDALFTLPQAQSARDAIDKLSQGCAILLLLNSTKRPAAFHSLL